MGVIDPAADHMEEVHSDCEVKALFPSTDEEPQAKGTAGTMKQKSYLTSHAHFYFKFVWIQRCVSIFSSTKSIVRVLSVCFGKELQSVKFLVWDDNIAAHLSSIESDSGVRHEDANLDKALSLGLCISYFKIYNNTTKLQEYTYT